MNDIIVCDKKQINEGKASSADIKVCTDDRGDDIVACKDECGGAQDPIIITLSGGIGIETGDFVSVVGGVPPYVIGISCGSVDQDTGEIDLTAAPVCCGNGTITATDSCGVSERVTVAFPVGQFVNDEFEPQPDPVYQIGSDPPVPATEAPGGCSVLPEENRITYIYFEAATCYFDKPVGAVWVIPPYTSELVTCPTRGSCLSGTGAVTHVTRWSTAIWSC